MVFKMFCVIIIILLTVKIYSRIATQEHVVRDDRDQQANICTL